jgi:hypothetical protein
MRTHDQSERVGGGDQMRNHDQSERVSGGDQMRNHDQKKVKESQVGKGGLPPLSQISMFSNSSARLPASDADPSGDS